MPKATACSALVSKSSGIGTAVGVATDRRATTGVVVKIRAGPAWRITGCSKRVAHACSVGVTVRRTLIVSTAVVVTRATGAIAHTRCAAAQ